MGIYFCSFDYLLDEQIAEFDRVHESATILHKYKMDLVRQCELRLKKSNLKRGEIMLLTKRCILYNNQAESLSKTILTLETNKGKLENLRITIQFATEIEFSNRILATCIDQIRTMQSSVARMDMMTEAVSDIMDETQKTVETEQSEEDILTEYRVHKMPIAPIGEVKPQAQVMYTSI